MPTPAALRTTNIAERIKARRLEIGLTQRDLAGDEYTRGFISQLENGLIAPSLIALQYIAERLGKPVSWFTADDERPEPEPNQVRITVTNNELRRLLRLQSLSDECLSLVERIASEFEGATDEQLSDTLNTLRWLHSLTPQQMSVLRGLMRELWK